MCFTLKNGKWDKNKLARLISRGLLNAEVLILMKDYNFKTFHIKVTTSSTVSLEQKRSIVFGTDYEAKRGKNLAKIWLPFPLLVTD